MKKLFFTLVAVAATTLMSAQIVKVKVIKPIVAPPRPVVVVSPRPVVVPTRPVVVVKPRPAPVRTVVVTKEAHDDNASDMGRKHRWKNHGKHKGHYKHNSDNDYHDNGNHGKDHEGHKDHDDKD